MRDWSGTSENQQIKEEVEKVWELSGSSSFNTNQLDLEEEFQVFEEKLNALPQETKVRRLRSLRPMLQLAASILLLICVYLFFFKPTNEQLLSTSTQQKEQKLVDLADGSQIWLNESSQLQYPEVFSKANRPVLFKGEGYFNIQKDKKKAFQITINEGLITVLGTSFNVRSRAEEQKAEITVKEGKVKFQFAPNAAEWVVEASERLIIDFKNKTCQKIIDSHLNALAWHTQELRFEGVPMDQAMLDFSRYFKVDIQIQNENLQKCKISSPLKVENLQDFLNTFEILFKAKVIKQAKGKYQIIEGECE